MKTHCIVLLAWSFCLANGLYAQNPPEKLKKEDMRGIIKVLEQHPVTTYPVVSEKQPARQTAAETAKTPAKQPASVPLRTFKMAKILNAEGKVIDSVKVDNTLPPSKSAPSRVVLPATANLIVYRTENAVRKIEVKGTGAAYKEKKVHYILPEVYEARSSSGEQISLRPVFHIAKNMRFDGDQRKFNGALNVFLLDELHPQESRQLVQPVKLRITALDGDATPATLLIGHTNLPDSSILISSADARDSLLVHLFTSGNPYGYTTAIPVKPTLLISNGSHSLQGFGIEQTEVSVLLRGVSSGAPQAVSLEASDGSVTPSKITVTPGQIQQVNFRSRGLSGGTLVAHTANTDSNTLAFNYAFPFAFLISALLGGMLGAFINFFRQPKTGDPEAQKSYWHFALTGLPWALIAALLYALGVNVLEGKFPTQSYFSEAVTFTLAALVVGLSIDIGKWFGIGK